MSTTYLTIVNHVLRRMRENEVTDITTNAYSKMVGDFVNDAKKEIQNSHDWSALRSVVTVSTSSGTSEYSITGSKEDPKIISAINDTQNLFLTYQTPVWMDNAYFNTDAPSGAPDTYTFNGIDSPFKSKKQNLSSLLNTPLWYLILSILNEAADASRASFIYS